LRIIVYLIMALVAIYLVARGIAELFVLHYSDPASYSNSWGGPSLAGVLAVHTGPAVLIVFGTALLVWRRQTARAR
jgi:hypothetical protein